MEKAPLKLTYQVSLRAESETDYTLIKTTDQLWNITGKDAFPHFSGNIKYKTELTISKPGGYILDLGRVGEAVRLYVNDRYAGYQLTPPYRFDLDGFLKPGKNKLSIIVSNTNAYARRDELSQYLQLEPSGLLGEVSLERYEIQTP